MNIKELLSHQSKDILLKLAELSDSDFNYEKYFKFNSNSLIARITKTDRTLEEIDDMLKTFGGIPLEEVEANLKKEAEHDLQEKEKEIDSDGVGARLTEVKKLQSEALHNNKINLRLQIEEMKRKALETVIVTVTPADPRDIECKKECEVFSIENQYFSVNKVIPFNVPCEVEKCIAELIKDTTYIKNIPNNTDVVKKTGKYSHQVVVPKYNVIINDVDSFKENNLNK